MIFYFPSKIDLDNLNKASKIRPYEFSKNLNDEDVFIHGNSFSRILKLYKCLLFYKGDKNIYIESNNFPFYLSEIRKLQLWFIFEILAFYIFKIKKFKIGLFYRDLFWRHIDFKPKKIKTYIRHLFFLIEWKYYCSIINVFFLPTKKIIKLLPKNNKIAKVLWVGLNVNFNEIISNNSTQITFLYIGGVLPPFYDLKPLFEIAKKTKKHKFIICTREKEWNYILKENIYDIGSNVEVVFKSYKEIPDLYNSMNTVLIDPRKPKGYYSYSLPFKYLEAASYGAPIINLKGTAADDFLEKYNYSWSFNSEQEIISFINELNPIKLNEKQKIINKTIATHTWGNRLNELRQVIINS